MIEGFLKEIGIKEQRTGGLPKAEYGRNQKTIHSGSKEDHTVRRTTITRFLPKNLVPDLCHLRVKRTQNNLN